MNLINLSYACAHVPVSCSAVVCAAGPGPETPEYSEAEVPAAGSRWPGHPLAHFFGSALPHAGANRSVGLHSPQLPPGIPEGLI